MGKYGTISDTQGISLLGGAITILKNMESSSMGLGWHPIDEMEKNMFETTSQRFNNVLKPWDVSPRQTERTGKMRPEMILIHPKIFGHFGMMPIDSPYSPWCSEVQHLHRFQPNLWGLKFCQDGSKSLGDPPSGPFYGGASLLDLARIRKWIAMEPQYSGLLILVEEDHYT